MKRQYLTTADVDNMLLLYLLIVYGQYSFSYLKLHLLYDLFCLSTVIKQDLVKKFLLVIII